MAAAARHLATPGLHAWPGGHADGDQPNGPTPGAFRQGHAAHTEGVEGNAAQQAGTAAGVGAGASGGKGGGRADSRGGSGGARMVPDTGSGPRLSEALVGAAGQQLLPDSQRGSNSPGKRKGALQRRPACSGGPPAAPDQAPCAELSSQGRHSAAGARARSGAADGGHAPDGGSQPGTQPSQLRPQEVFPQRLSGHGGGAPGSQWVGAEPSQAAGSQPEGAAGAGQPQAGGAQEQWHCAVRALCSIVARKLGTSVGAPAPAAQRAPASSAEAPHGSAEASPLPADMRTGIPPEEGEPPSNVWFSARSPGRAGQFPGMAGQSQPSSSEPSQQQACRLQEALSLSMRESQPLAAPVAPAPSERQHCGEEAHVTTDLGSAGDRSAQADEALAGRRSKRPLWPDGSQVAPAPLEPLGDAALQGASLSNKRRRIASSPDQGLGSRLEGAAQGEAAGARGDADVADAKAGMPADGTEEHAGAGAGDGAELSGVDEPPPPLTQARSSLLK